MKKRQLNKLVSLAADIESAIKMLPTLDFPPDSAENAQDVLTCLRGASVRIATLVAAIKGED